MEFKINQFFSTADPKSRVKSEPLSTLTPTWMSMREQLGLIIFLMLVSEDHINYCISHN